MTHLSLDLPSEDVRAFRQAFPEMLVIHDWADLIEQPMHRLGLHGAAWVITAGCLGLLLLAAMTMAFRRLASSGGRSLR